MIPISAKKYKINSNVVRLKLAGFGPLKLDGRMNADQKAAAIASFNDDPDCNVFLVSLKAGGMHFIHLHIIEE